MIDAIDAKKVMEAPGETRTSLPEITAVLLAPTPQDADAAVIKPLLAE